MKVYTLAEITMTGSAIQVDTSSQPKQWKWWAARAMSVASASAPIRVGDSNTTTTQGAPLTAAGQEFVARPTPPDTEHYTSTDVWVAGAAGDKVSILYAI